MGCELKGGDREEYSRECQGRVKYRESRRQVRDLKSGVKRLRLSRTMSSSVVGSKLGDLEHANGGVPALRMIEMAP